MVSKTEFFIDHFIHLTTFGQYDYLVFKKNCFPNPIFQVSLDPTD